MDNNTWLWEKRSTAKTLEADKANEILRCEEEKSEGPHLETKELERDLKLLNERLSSALAECNAKDNIALKRVKIAEQAIAGWEKAEKEAVSLKLELDKVLKQKAASEERLVNMDAVLRECMQELRHVREEHDKKVQSAVMKTSEAREISNVDFGEKLGEALKRVSKLEAENAQFVKAASVKDKVIEDLSKCRTQIEADFNALILRLDTTKKENDSVTSEVRVLQKELHICNEEREFHRGTSVASEKRLEENAKRTAKLEAECHRLRILVSKGSPAASALAKANNDISRSHKVDVMLDKSQNVQTISETGKDLCFLRENPMAPLSDMGSDDKVSCAESWASALLSEIEHFRTEKKLGAASNRSMMLASDMNLMDDFAEMEKLAIVSVNNLAERETTLQVSTDKASDKNKSDNKVQADVSVPINKILELLEGINIKTQDTEVMDNFVKDDDNKLLPYKNSETSTGYIVRVFQWRSAELSTVLQRFIQICNDLLNGTATLEQFVQQVASDLEWVMSHCFSLRDVSSMKESIINHLDWDESVSETEVALGSVHNSAEGERLKLERISNTSLRDDSCHVKASQPIITEEFKTWNNELADKEFSGMDLDGLLQSEIANGECLRTQLQESKSVIEKLQSEIESMKQSQGTDGNRVETQQTITRDSEAHVTETNREYERGCPNKSHLQNPLNSETKSFQKLDGAKIPPECSRIDKGRHDPKCVNHFQNDLEITAASEKLAKCQETILDLGKQLKSLASPNDAAIFEKVLSKSAVSASDSSSSMGRSTGKRSSLLDKMLAEDRARLAAASRTTTINKGKKGISSCALISNSSTMDSWGKLTVRDEVTDDKDAHNSAAANMDIIHCTKRDDDRSFFKKLFGRRKKKVRTEKLSVS